MESPVQEFEHEEGTEESRRFFHHYGFVLACVDLMEQLIIKPTVKAIQQRGGGHVVALDYRGVDSQERLRGQGKRNKR